MDITKEQCRAARALLNVNQSELADAIEIGRLTIVRFESDDEDSSPSLSTLNKIKTYFDNRGIEFIEGGVRKTSTIITLRNKDGFKTFLDDVYYTATKHGTKENPCEIFLSNVVHNNWIKWMGADKWLEHTARMERNKDLIDVRILIKEGDLNFPASSYSKYKWTPKERFRGKSFYSYHDKLAFMHFKEDSVTITVIKQADFAEGYRNHFIDTWNHASIEVKN